MKNRPKPKIRPVDYHLKSGIAMWILGLTTSGRSPRKRGLQAPPAKVHSKMVLKCNDYWFEYAEENSAVMDPQY
jgi:hypothetical protein